jgi:3-methyl-2-oxobutanoate hydroxymethyltransferase
MDPIVEAVSKITVPRLLERKVCGERITCLTAYDFPTARLVDESGIDIVLVGDSLGTVVLGYESTVPVTEADMLHHLRAVRRAVRRALLVADMPYGTYHVSDEEGVAAAVRFFKEGAEAVKIEGGCKRAPLIRRLREAEIPVMGHVGLTPQSFHVLGGHRVQGKTCEAAARILEDACAIEDAGAFALVLEGIPRELAARITEQLHIPTIGIGAGPDCDGQVLVLHDLIGLSWQRRPKFVRPYANTSCALRGAIEKYRDDVREGSFPADAESYHWPEDVREQVENLGSDPVLRAKR